MTSPVVSPQPAANQGSTVWRPGWPSRIFALTPLWAQIIIPFAAPTFFGPRGDTYSNTLGVVVTGLVMFWMLIGLYVVWNARTLQVVAVAYALFTIPATLALIWAPALVLILQNAS